MSFKNILGQDAAVALLKSLLTTRRLPPALLFYGPDGVGKSMAALEFAKALNCASGDACGTCDSCAAADKGVDMDLKRLNAAYQAMLLEEEVEKQQSIKIESIRNLVKDMEMRSLMGRWKTAIIEDAHKMQPAAANALLKALEEPPPRSLWILLTARKEAILPTVLSRCHALSFHSLPKPLVESILIRRGVPAKGALKLATISEGSPGKALTLQSRDLRDPADWTQTPMGPLRLVEELPRELHLARPIVESHLQNMAWHLRLRLKPEQLRRSRVQKAFAQLDSLKRSLRSNADPKVVLELAALETQALDSLL